MQYELNLRDYIRIFQKRKWTIILMPVLAGLLARCQAFADGPGAGSSAPEGTGRPTSDAAPHRW